MQETDYEEELRLIDLIRVLWKWKLLIAGGVLASVLIAAVVIMTTPKVYGLHMVVQPGVVEVKENGKTVYIDTLPNIKEVIASGAFKNELSKRAKDLNAAAFFKGLKLALRPPKRPVSLKISHETIDVETGLEAMKQLERCLSEKYEKTVEMHRKLSDIKIGKIRNAYLNLGSKIKEKTNGFLILRTELEAESGAAIHLISTVKARIDAKNAELSHEQKQKELQAYIYQQWELLSNAYRQVSFENEAVILAKKSLYVSEEQFKVGRISDVQFRESQLALINALVRHEAALFQYKVATAQLQQLAGKLVIK